jgi:xanthosine utilization system XapX-like protein
MNDINSPYVLSQDNLAGALASAVTGLIVWAVNSYTTVQIPAGQAVALGTIIYFLVTHFVPVQKEKLNGGPSQPTSVAE